MATRTAPPPRTVYERKSEVGHYRLTFPEERAALAALREKEARGEIEIDMITMPPQIDNKGVPHVTVLYWSKRLLTEDEIDRLEKKQLDEINKQARTGNPGRPPSPGPVPGLALTDEERELLAPWRGPRDD